MLGTVSNVGPGVSIVRLDTGETVAARNGLNLRTPPRSRVVAVKTARGWVVVGRQR